MKKKGKMAACLILLVLLLAVLVVLTKKNSTADADSSSSDSGADAEKVVDFSKDDVTALSFRINGETVSFTKTAGDDDTDIWTYDQEDGFPLDEGKITSVLSSLSSMTAERVIEGDEIDSMADFGLETPSQEVIVTAGDEKTTIHVGDKNSSSRYYIYLNDDTSKVYLVSTSLGTMFPSDMMEWATTESMPSVTAENITKLQVEGENGYTLTKEVSAADSALQTDEWQVVDADGAAHGGDADSIGTMTSAVASLSFGDLVTYNASDLSQYGLDQPKTTIRVHYTEEQEVEADDTTTADTSSDSTADSASSDSTATSSSAETEVSETVDDVFALVFFDSLENMRVMTAYQIRSLVDRKVSKCSLVAVRDFFFLIAPVEDHDRDLRAVCFYLGDVLLELFFTFEVILEFVDSYKSDFDPLHFRYNSLIITKIQDTGIVKCLNSISIALIAIIMTVVVGSVDCFDGTGSEDAGILGRSFESIFLVLALLRICESSFKVGDRQIICGKNALHIGEEIICSVILIISIKTGIVVKVFVCTERTVTYDTDGQRYRSHGWRWREVSSCDFAEAFVLTAPFLRAEQPRTRMIRSSRIRTAPQPMRRRSVSCCLLR